MAEPADDSTAVVIGGGISGLVVAEVLSKHFGRVVLLERDHQQPVWGGSAVQMACDKQARPGVSQYNQLHAMTAQGLAVFDEIFQGRFSAALLAAGGNLVDMASAFVYFHPDSGTAPWLRTTPSQPLTSAVCSRHLLESTARQLVSANPRVTLRLGVAVTGLLFEPPEPGHASAAKPTAAVTGVTLAGGGSQQCDLVVDCAGRSSSLPGWLAAAGWPRPRVTRVTAGAGYASWFVRLAPEVEAALMAAGVYGVAAVASPTQQTFALLLREENNTWMAGLGGHNNWPSRKDEQLLDFAEKELWTPVFAELLRGSRPLAPACRFTGLANTWRHYDGALPSGLLPFADSIASFSPVYAQGMTVAAIEAAALDKLLSQRRQQRSTVSSSDRPGAGRAWLAGLAGEFLAAVQPTIKSAWQLAAGNDSRYPGATVNEACSSSAISRTVEGALFGYMTSIFKLAASDATVQQQLMRVLHMVDGPELLLQPAIAARVLLQRAASLLPLRSNRTRASRGSCPAATDLQDEGAVDSTGQQCRTLMQLLHLA